jgi:hypothetical protein
MSEPRRRYMAYLLRLWQVRSEEGTAWRASLESAQGGERKGFASLSALFDFLRRRTEEGEVNGEEIAGREKGRLPDRGIQRKSTWVLPACASFDSLRRRTEEGGVIGDDEIASGEERQSPHSDIQ